MGHRGWKPLPDGTRVRHYGHQWPEAYRNGTATIVRHFWNGVWLEYVVRLDRPDGVGKTEGEWSADYTVKIQGMGDEK